MKPGSVGNASQFPGRSWAEAMISNRPVESRTISAEVRPVLSLPVGASAPLLVIGVKVQKRAAGIGLVRM